MTLDAALKWAPLALSIINLGAYLILWIARGAFVSREEHMALDRRVLVVEGAVQSAPGWTPLNDIREKLGTLDGDVKAMRAEIKGTREIVGLIQEHLMARSGDQ